MSLITKSTLLKETPAIRTSELSNMSPAGYIPKMSSCDPHEKALLPQVVQLWLFADFFAFKTHLNT